MQNLVEAIPFRDKARAEANLASLKSSVPEAALTRVRLLLAAAADPDAAVHYICRLAKERPGAFQRIGVSPAGLQYVVTVFSSSRFLSEAVLANPEWIQKLPADGDLHRVISASGMRKRLEIWLADEGEGAPPAIALARFRRRQVLRILVRDLLGFGTLAEITEELSSLADAILDVSYRRIRAELIARYGTPRHGNETGQVGECGMSILGLGKLGGQELNYSSDIDLMFLYGAAGETDGAEVIANRVFFGKVANHLTTLLSTYTNEGSSYRVDLRLRPEGRLGEVAINAEAARAYYGERARDWELQMLIKARVAAGEPGPGNALLEFVEPLIYQSTLDFSAVESASETRARISEKAASRRRRNAGTDVKLARGGIRDIEFLVQCLQRLHGGRNTWVRHGGTMLALRRLQDKDFLSEKEYSRLADAYEFLRNLEHRLQVLDDRQTHELPTDEGELELLARRMPLGRKGETPSASRLRRRINRHLEEVQEIYERVIHSQQPVYYSAAPTGSLQQPQSSPLDPPSDRVEHATTNLVRYLDDRAPKLAQSLSRSKLRRGAKHFEFFLEQVMADSERLGWLESDQVLASYVFDLFEQSSFFAEQLVRRHNWLDDLRDMRSKPDAVRDYKKLAQVEPDAASLRRFFLQEILRIEANSICLAAPIFTTLKRTSELADAVVAASYEMAVADTLEKCPPEVDGYRPSDQLMVIALGRLGMVEFDVASDADLVFALPDEDAEALSFWTRVAERMIQIITSYTGEGTMFAVDTRLRPGGREGMLVQTVQRFKDYFAGKAAAWEGITYMKSRTIAGNIERGTEFLNELQDVDWRRYGQTARSKKQLWDMRMRLEKEQGPGNPLKAGRGGYYDIDFALMYLRLKSAGIFFKVLNTPERIDIIEKMGHLDRSDAAFLHDAATFYRSVDHGLRVYSGQAGGRLPRTQYKLVALDQLVSRWTPEHLHDQPLDVELAQIQSRTREFFERLFS